MKKIINGSKFDTETAKMIAVNSYGQVGDFSHWEEELYRTKSGKFFLYGVGGPNSKYGVWEGNEGYGDEKIMPMSEDEAKTWAKNALNGDEYEKAFGTVEEGDMTQICATITPEQKEKLDEKKKELRMTTSELIQKLIDEM